MLLETGKLNFAQNAILNDNQRLLLKAIGEVALFFFCMVPGLVFSFKSLQEPWNLFRMARAHLFLQNPERATFITAGAGYRGEHVGVEMIQTTLITVTGWPLESIALIPIGSLLLALLYYGLAHILFHSSWTAAAITLYLTWYYPTLYSQYSTQTFVWTHVLFLSFLILLLYWMRQRTPILSILIMVVFLAAFFQYHTTPLWIISALTTAVATIKLDEYRQKISPTAVSWALPLFCTVFYFTFDTVVYGNGLARLKSESVNESFLQSFFYKIVTPLLSYTPDNIPNAFEAAHISPRTATWSTLLILLLLTIPIGVWTLVKIYRVIISHDITTLIWENNATFIWIVIIVAVTHMVIYSLYGALSLRVIPLAFPLILPLSLRSFRWGPKLEPIFASGLALLAIVGFISFASTLRPDILASQTGLASKLFEEDDQLLGDANVYGAFLLNSAQDNKIIDFVWPNSAKYGAVVGQVPFKPDEFDYLVVDMTNKPVTSANWRFLEPWTRYLPAINRNNNLNKVYDSEYLKIFQPSEMEFPNYQLTPPDFTVAGRSLVTDTFRLFLTIVILAFIPGAVLMALVYHNLPAQINNMAAVGLAVGLSIAFATILSYIADFTPFGLAWFVPLGALATLDVLGIYLFIHCYKFRLHLSWIIFIASLMITVLIWSFLSTSVAHARTQQYTEFTEFFVTRTDPQSSMIEANVVNRTNEPGNFTISFSLDGTKVQTIGPKLLAPNSLGVEGWSVPLTPMNGRFVITLEKDGTPYRELWLNELGDEMHFQSMSHTSGGSP